MPEPVTVLTAQAGFDVTGMTTNNEGVTPLPVRFTGRWGNHSRLSYDNAVCWHVLLGGDTGAQAAAAAARHRLAGFASLHMTPPGWLHVTVLWAGTAETVTQDDMSRVLTTAQAKLAGTAPVTVTLQHVLYHPEAIALSVAPRSALAPVLVAAQTATREALGPDTTGGEEAGWVPHVTLCYCTAEQPTAPVIAKLGETIPPCEVTIGELSLVVQDGPEDEWNWRVVGHARLLGGMNAPGA